jgi:hypothetical protein
MNQPDSTMQIHLPEVIAELEQAFDTLKTLDRSFWYAPSFP